MPDPQPSPEKGTNPSDTALKARALEQQTADALATQLHSMDPKERRAISNQIKADELADRKGVLPKVEFNNYGDVKSIEVKGANGFESHKDFDERTGRV